jgi:hypothetical protein
MLPLLSILCACRLAISAAAQASYSESGEKAPITAHALYPPLAGMQNFEEWDLVLLNRNLIAEDVTVTIHSSVGKRLPANPRFARSQSNEAFGCSPLSTLQVDQVFQTWNVGGGTNGPGLTVQTDTRRRYVDHGLHAAIVSPTR